MYKKLTFNYLNFFNNSLFIVPKSIPKLNIGKGKLSGFKSQKRRQKIQIRFKFENCKKCCYFANNVKNKISKEVISKKIGFAGKRSHFTLTGRPKPNTIIL